MTFCAMEFAKEAYCLTPWHAVSLGTSMVPPQRQSRPAMREKSMG